MKKVVFENQQKERDTIVMCNLHASEYICIRVGDNSFASLSSLKLTQDDLPDECYFGTKIVREEKNIEGGRCQICEHQEKWQERRSRWERKPVILEMLKDQDSLLALLMTIAYDFFRNPCCPDLWEPSTPAEKEMDKYIFYPNGTNGSMLLCIQRGAIGRGLCGAFVWEKGETLVIHTHQQNQKALLERIGDAILLHTHN